MKLSHAFSYLPKSPLIAIAGFLTAVSLSVGAFAAFGPDRPTLTWTGNDTAGADHVVFNSFVNNPTWGDERDFARGIVEGRDSNWADPLFDVSDSQTIKVAMYIHNNADASLNASGDGIAKNTRLAVNIPTNSAKNHEISGTISADNATPGSIFDTVSVNSNGFFELEYIPGSARIEGNHVNSALSDDIINGGVLLGDALDGNVKGCFDGSVYVTFEVKVNAPRYEIQKTVRVKDSGPGNWVENVNLKAGEVAEWQIRFENSGSTTLNNVVLLDQIPDGLTVVPGSIELINANNPIGKAVSDAAIQNNGSQINAMVGSYEPTGVAYLYFYTTVDSGLQCDVDNGFVNKAFATPEGYGSIWDDASVNVTIACETPNFEYACNTLNVVVLNKNTRQVKATADLSHSSNVTLVGTEINFGDGTVLNTNPATHKFAKDGHYTVVATTAFQLNNDTKSGKEVNCSGNISFTTEVAKCTVPGFTNLDANDPNCKTTPNLPNTGAGTFVYTFFGATTVASAAYGFIKKRLSA